MIPQFEQLTELPRRYQYETLDSAIDFLRYTKTAAEPRVIILAIWGVWLRYGTVFKMTVLQANLKVLVL